MNGAGRIDFHHHVVPPSLVASTPTPMAVPDTARQLAGMDKLGIAAACVSVTPRIFLKRPDLAGTARVANEHMAGLIERHPSRFAAFAALPIPDMPAAVAEIRHALDVLKLDGVGMFSSQQDVFLGDERYDPVMAELNARGAVVLVHPAHALAPKALNLKIDDGAVEYMFDSTRAIANMLVCGVFERFPDIRFVFTHAGGAVPYLTGRIAIVTGLKDVPEQLSRAYFDLANSATPYAIPALQALVDPSHILWGSDLPFVNGEAQDHEIAQWEAYKGFTAAERQQVERGNALRLFPRLARALAD